MTRNYPVISQRKVAMMILDAIAIALSFLFVLLARFDFIFSVGFLALFFSALPYVWAAYLAAAMSVGLYRRINHFASVDKMSNLVWISSLGGLLDAAALLAISRGHFPRSVLLFHPFLVFFGLGIVRAVVFEAGALRRRLSAAGGKVRRVVLVGAGEMGEILLTQLQRERSPRYKVLAIVDDDPRKKRMKLKGVRVVGGRRELPRLLRSGSVDEIIVAVAAARGRLVRAVVDASKNAERSPEIRVAPTLQEMLRAPRDAVNMRKVRPADLLNREVAQLDVERIGETLMDKTVLVSGAGGTIGAELCRQVLRYRPGKLVLLENHATALFYLQKELASHADKASIVPVLGDVRDVPTLERVFSIHRPQVVLHAAAHKHVEQLEFNVQEAIANNTLGTYRIASAADRHGAEVFLLISTDKAVRPKSVMGATKRAAEIVVKTFGNSSRTRFVAVRFGNVLGSSGSALKIFQEQISKGESITVTDASATRYFMTVEEAVGLILQAATMAKGGDIFVLKMGQPVRVMDLAKNLIALSGLELGRDIEIKVTGLRRGEKLHEELVEDPAGVDASIHPEIMRLRAENWEMERLAERMLELQGACGENDPEVAIRRLSALVPTFEPAAAERSAPNAAPAELHLN